MSGQPVKQEEDGEADRELVRHALSDPAARDLLVRRLQPRVQRLARAFLRHSADAEDAAEATRRRT